MVNSTKRSPLPSQETLREILDYTPCSGGFRWKKRGVHWFEDNSRFKPEAAARMWNGKMAGKRAFQSINPRGYRSGALLGETRLAHRVAWKWCHGFEPDVIDHINGDKLDNRIDNLRSVTACENSRNRRQNSNNRSGHLGVTEAPYGQWKAQIGEEAMFLGYFDTYAEAVAARKGAERALGYHENHGGTNRG